MSLVILVPFRFVRDKPCVFLHCAIVPSSCAALFLPLLPPRSFLLFAPSWASCFLSYLQLLPPRSCLLYSYSSLRFSRLFPVFYSLLSHSNFVPSWFVPSCLLNISSYFPNLPSCLPSLRIHPSCLPYQSVVPRQSFLQPHVCSTYEGESVRFVEQSVCFNRLGENLQQLRWKMMVISTGDVLVGLALRMSICHSADQIFQHSWSGRLWISF